MFELYTMKTLNLASVPIPVLSNDGKKGSANPQNLLKIPELSGSTEDDIPEIVVEIATLYPFSYIAFPP